MKLTNDEKNFLITTGLKFLIALAVVICLAKLVIACVL